MAKQPHNTPAQATTPLGESPWHIKSIIVYVAAVVAIVDVILQATAHDIWSAATSGILAIFLSVESYVRIKKQRTSLGKTFAPLLAGILIIIVVVDHGVGGW